MVDEAAIVGAEAVGAEERRLVRDRPSGRRKKISSTSASTWTSRSASSSAADEKVSCRGVDMHRGLERRHGKERSDALTSDLVIGTLKGYDQLMNLVLDEVKEALTGTSLQYNPRPL